MNNDIKILRDAIIQTYRMLQLLEPSLKDNETDIIEILNTKETTQLIENLKKSNEKEFNLLLREVKEGLLGKDHFQAVCQ